MRSAAQSGLGHVGQDPVHIGGERGRRQAPSPAFRRAHTRQCERVGGSAQVFSRGSMEPPGIEKDLINGRVTVALNMGEGLNPEP